MSKKAPSKTPVMTEKLTQKEFIERAIKALKKPGYNNIHVVYSGFNEAFRQYFNEDPRVCVDQLVKDGVLTCRPARGGAVIALASDSPEEPKGNASTALAKILTQS